MKVLARTTLVPLKIGDFVQDRGGRTGVVDGILLLRPVRYFVKPWSGRGSQPTFAEVGVFSASRSELQVASLPSLRVIRRR